MQSCFFSAKNNNSTPLYLYSVDKFSGWLNEQSLFVQNWLKHQHTTAKSGSYFLIPDEEGNIVSVAVFFGHEQPMIERLAQLPLQLPAGDYHLIAKNSDPLLWLGWGMGAYHFTLFKNKTDKLVRLAYSLPSKEVINTLDAIYLVRDLINLPPDHMGPVQLASVAKKIAQQFSAVYSEVVGKDLLKQNFPAIYTVGRASAQSPRFIHFHWGKKSHPKIALIGKGVCFDTGGLDIKPSGGMRLMKKDMGGAAHVLALAQLIMAQKLPLQLDVCIPAVENSVSGDAMHPRDVITMRNGKTVEVDNTDAEGRLILADAITFALEQKPDLIIDFATLTGAARVAVGTEISAYFCNEVNVAKQLQKIGTQVEDPLWELPLYQPYFKDLKSYIADFKNSGGSYGSAITAALFLQQFMTATIPWLHFDIMAWNAGNRPAHPEGGEAMGLRAVYEYLLQGKF